MESLKNRPINQAFKRNSNDGLVIGNVNVKNIGKSSLQLSNNELIIKSFKTSYVYTESIDKVDYLAYSSGNFFIDEKIFIGINGEQFEISCKEDEFQFKNFFDTIKRIKHSRTANQNLLEDTVTGNQELPETNTSKVDEKKSEDEEIEEEPKLSPSEEIRNFYNLMKEGIISEEEFEEKKNELLKL